jgi:hypothetical protein
MPGPSPVQWLDSIPPQRMQVSYEAVTASSLGPWKPIVSLPLSAGRPLHSCPRFATDMASFLMVYELKQIARLPANFQRHIACAAHVVLRLVTITGPDRKGVVTVSVTVESFQVY